jgi:hypothetical protein
MLCFTTSHLVICLCSILGNCIIVGLRKQKPIVNKLTTQNIRLTKCIRPGDALNVILNSATEYHMDNLDNINNDNDEQNDLAVHNSNKGSKRNTKQPISCSVDLICTKDCNNNHHLTIVVRYTSVYYQAPFTQQQ